MRPMAHGTVLFLLLGLSLVAGCAGRRLYEPNTVSGGTQLVASDEPLERVTGPLLPPQPVDSSSPDPLLAAMARMVANGGAWRPLAWRGVSGMDGRHCRRGGPVVLASPLTTTDPRAALAEGWWSRQWVHAGLTLEPGAGQVGVQLRPCGGTHATTAVASRGGLLAPAVAGRDTSVLFTTRRANATAAPGAGIVEAVIEQFVSPRAADGESRKATPRLRPRG